MRPALSSGGSSVLEGSDEGSGSEDDEDAEGRWEDLEAREEERETEERVESAAGLEDTRPILAFVMGFRWPEGWKAESLLLVRLEACGGGLSAGEAFRLGAGEDC